MTRWFYGLNCVPSIVIRWSPDSLYFRIWLLRGRCFKKVIKFRRGHLGLVLMQLSGIVVRKKKNKKNQTQTHREAPEMPTKHRKGHRRHNEKAAFCKLRREALEDSTHAGTLISTSSLQNCEKIHFCRLSCPVYGVLLWQPKQTNTHGYYNFLTKTLIAAIY